MDYFYSNCCLHYCCSIKRCQFDRRNRWSGSWFLCHNGIGIRNFCLGIWKFDFSDYLNIMYIPKVGEVMIFVASFSGALIGFLWFNTYPATVFMGDTGSLTIGGVIAVIALIVRKELLIPLLCGIFLVENLSVLIQVGYFKYSRKKTGEGKRIFKWLHCTIITKNWDCTRVRSL